MADKENRRRNSKFQRSASTESADSISPMGRSIKERKNKKPKERWLLTRKTWRYMADAGKKLIPEGALNRPEDIPKIEAHFQELCKREPRFLLWRKNSYPGALALKKKRKFKGGSCRKASSEDEVDVKPVRPKDLPLYAATSGGRFDIQKLKYDFLNQKTPSPIKASPRSYLKNKETFPIEQSKNKEETKEDEIVEEGERQLMTMLEQILDLNKNDNQNAPQSTLNHQELVDKLQRHLTIVSRNIPSQNYANPSYKRDNVRFEGDHVQKSLTETLSRYFSQYPNRDKVISDLLTDRKALEKLYFELRKTKGFGSNRSGTSLSKANLQWSPSLLRKYNDSGGANKNGTGSHMAPPIIEIEPEKIEITYRSGGTQTMTIPEATLFKLEDEFKKLQADREEERKYEAKHAHRRRSSIDNDDVSQSVSDTIKRYLRMARKKSVDSDKADRFKRVNYDRNLRNIKAKGEITKPGDDDGLNKGCQTNEEWILTYRDLQFDVFSEPNSRVSSCRSSFDAGGVEDHNRSSPTSPGFMSSGHSFLSSLLHSKHSHDKSGAAVTGAGAMQKSKSSSSVMHHGSRLMAKKIFRSRSKSQTRVSHTPSAWTPQGSCVWSSVNGKQVVLNDTTLLQLTEVERKVLQKVALAKLQALNLGVSVKVPPESVPGSGKPKRRPYLLKRKALTTGIFDSSSRKEGEKEKDSSTSGGLVFGIPLAQCVENDRISRLAAGASPFRSQVELSGSGDDGSPMGRHGSRASFSSLVDAPRGDESGSCESLLTRDRIVGSVPGLLDSLSIGSTADIPVTAAATEVEGPAVPNILNVCFRHLETHGLHTLGIFRVSTSKKRIRQLREDFDCGKENTLEDEQCPHDVATLLKEYLRDLPDPLLCRDLYHAFVHTQRIRNRSLQLEALQHLVQLLPSVHRDTLWALLSFLTNVAKHANDRKDENGDDIPGNKMDSTNLATVFAPNVLHCVKPGSTKDSDRAEDRLDVINVIRILIDNAKEIFRVPAEILDEVYIHMMDTHPEILDQLLNKREAMMPADESQDDLDSESNSNTWTPPAQAIEQQIQVIRKESDGRDTPPEPRRTWSREEFLHEAAATGGPNVAMRLRHKDRMRERNSKKRREESKKKSEETSSPISSAMTIISRFRSSSKDEDGHQFAKTRSSSLESNTSLHHDANEIQRILRLHEDGQGIDRRKSTPYIMDNSGVITASLTIPVQTTNQGGLSALNVNDDDIPYIEDGSYADTGKQHMTIGLVRTPTAPPRRRQRSISGSDSSVASNIQLIQGNIGLAQQGYDSAVGSSLTYSSPPQNTTPSSRSSSIPDPGMLSSPPSWASTPPTSPDSVNTSVNYIPDETSSSTSTRTIHSQRQPAQKVSTKDAPILQKVSFTSTTELQQARKKLPEKTYIGSSTQKTTDVQKSPSMPGVQVDSRAVEKNSPSITNIGNAVLRSKTADFERMAKIEAKSISKPESDTSNSSSSDKKKYTKRRYTDTRHQTRHIPDSGALEATSSTTIKKEEKTTTQTTVYKRRELISSVPSK